MARMIRKETIENVSKHFTALQNAVTNAAAEEKSLAAGIESGVLTPEGMRDGLARVVRNQQIAADSAQYLGNLCGAFLAEIGAKSPSRMAEVFKVLESDLPNIVDAVNEKKSETKEKAEDRKRAEMEAAVTKRLREIQEAAATRNAKK